MMQTKESMTRWLLEVANGDGFEFVLERTDAGNTLCYVFDLLGALKRADIRIIVSDGIRVVATPQVELPTASRDRVGEFLTQLNLRQVGNFSLDYDTGVIQYVMDVRFEDISTPADIEFLWLVPLGILETLNHEL